MEGCETGLSADPSQASWAARGRPHALLLRLLTCGFIVHFSNPASSTWWEMQSLVLLVSHSPTWPPLTKDSSFS